LLKDEHLAVLSAAGETLLNQAFSLPPFWNGLPMYEDVTGMSKTLLAPVPKGYLDPLYE
jgi:hypothetical protein